jgi:hypothetical protein
MPGAAEALRITKRTALTFVSLHASGHTIFSALAQAVRHHFNIWNRP